MTKLKEKTSPERERIVMYFTIDRELHAKLVRYLSSTRPAPDKTAALRVALEDFLKAKGF